MGSNMAECHPVGFQWVMEAQARGAKVIHVDPRFTRTSAVADLHVPIRAGSDIAFLGGIVNHILQNGREFREYVQAYTNASTILREDFRDTEDLDGVFSGWEVAETLCERSGRERTSAFCYAVGWTQHSVGVQYIRTAAIVQLLLGNIGRPGGGILALRGHASIQGSTDIPTLYDILPGYIPMPHAQEHQTLAEHVAQNSSATGDCGHMDAYVVSLLQACWSDAATAENDYCFDYLPRIDGDHSTY